MAEWTSVSAVALDAVGTLIYAAPSVSRAYAQIAARHGSQRPEAEIRTRFREALAAFDRDFRDNGFRTSEQREAELWRDVVTSVVDDVDDPDACYAELFHWFGQSDSWREYDDTGPALQMLVGRQVNVAIASNFDHRLHTVCAGLPSVRRIRTRVVSSEVGFRKPSREYYNRLADTLGCPADKILMVGDTPSNDVDGARAAGFLAVLIDRDREPDFPNRISSLTQISELLSRV